MSICVKHRTRASMIVRYDLRKYKRRYVRKHMQQDKQERAVRIRKKQQAGRMEGSAALPARAG